MAYCDKFCRSCDECMKPLCPVCSGEGKVLAES